MMGRQVRRVAMDFDWPLNKPWEGYVNPYYRECPDCQHGQTASLAALERLVHLLLIAGADSAAHKQPHPWLVEAGISDVGDKLHEVTTALCGRKPSFFGHDGCDRWTAQKAIIAAAGLPEDWGQCPTCNGDAIDPAIREQYEAWQETDPPAGEGWQMWETVSEGSPISPVFETPEELARYCSQHPWGGEGDIAYEAWLQMITGGGWAPCLVVDDQGIRSGVEFVADGGPRPHCLR